MIVVAVGAVVVPVIMVVPVMIVVAMIVVAMIVVAARTVDVVRQVLVRLARRLELGAIDRAVADLGLPNRKSTTLSS